MGWILVCIGLVFWFVYVWPTPWRYYKQGALNLRVNRFTGRTELLERNGWRGERRDSDRSAPMYINGVKVDLPKLRQAMPAENLELQSSLNTLSISIRYGQYAEAVAGLEKLANNAALTEPQKRVVDQVIAQMKAVCGVRP